MNNIEQAVKLKLRWGSLIGSLSVEDLYDLPITSRTKANLKDIAIDLQGQISTSPTTALDFLDGNSSVDPILQLKFDIIKGIIIEKQAEAKAKSEAKVIETRNAEVLELIKLKKQEQLAGKSLEELEAMLA